MKFTYEAYGKLLEKLEANGYEFSNYKNWNEKKKPVILRHDIDYDIDKAVKMAEFEMQRGVQSTYFALLTSDFYNAFSKDTYDGIQKILCAGHWVGLHFDECRYPDSKGNLDIITKLIQEEAHILGNVIGRRVDVVSMHRPSKIMLEADLKISGIINSYSKIFYKTFKYVSDSRRRWREPVEKIIENRQYERIHLLTHAFWYNDQECDLLDSVYRFVNSGNQRLYRCLSSNITDLESIMSREEIVIGKREGQEVFGR